MYFYQIYGMNVASDLQMVEAYEPDAAEGTAEITIQKTDLGALKAQLDSMIPQWGEEQPSLLSKIDRAQSTLYYCRIGIFRISNGSLIEYMPLMDDQSPVFRQWMLCMALAVARIQREEITIHGSGLMLPEQDTAFIISGDSGSGKSTLSDALLEAGCRFLADDAVALRDLPDAMMADGAYPTRRLCMDVVAARHLDPSQLCYINDGGKEKYILDMSDAYYGMVPRPLRAMFVITVSPDSTQVSAREITGGEKLKMILHNLYKRDTYLQMGMTPQVFSRCTRIAQTVPLYELCRPADSPTVPELTRIVMDLMEKQESGTL